MVGGRAIDLIESRVVQRGDPMVAKTEFRKSFKALLSAQSFSTEKHALASARLSERLEDFFRQLMIPEKNASDGWAGHWAAFQPFDIEPDIAPALKRIERHFAGRINWVYPRIENEHLRFYSASDAGCFEVNEWNIREPRPGHCELIETAMIRGFLVPGFAFDQSGRRMGRGRGFYDRVLGSSSSNAYKLGIALDRQISSHEIPVESFDIAMDGILTESRFFGRAPWNDAKGFENERNFKWTRS